MYSREVLQPLPFFRRNSLPNLITNGLKPLSHQKTGRQTNTQTDRKAVKRNKLYIYIVVIITIIYIIVESGQSFYVDSKACVRVGMDVSEWFSVNVGLREGFVMPPWLFNVYNGVVREVNGRVLGKVLELQCKCSQASDNPAV